MNIHATKSVRYSLWLVSKHYGLTKGGDYRCSCIVVDLSTDGGRWSASCPGRALSARK